MRETALWKKIARALLKDGAVYVEKVHGSRYTKTGEPDLNVFYVPERSRFARTLKLEVKMPGEKPEPIQLVRLAEWENRSVPSAWVTTVAFAREVFAEFRREVDTEGK